MSFKAHWQYLKYVIEHKRYVYQEGRYLGVGRWQLLIHDWTKFLPSEWGPYVRKFYGYLIHQKQFKNWARYAEYRKGLLKKMPQVPQRPPRRDHEKINREFKVAWLHHQNHNKHHWQYWVLLNDFGNPEACLEMPEKYMLEMIADWKGAGRAKHHKHDPEEVANELKEFYINTAAHRRLHPVTKMRVEDIIGVEVPSIEILQDPGYPPARTHVS